MKVPVIQQFNNNSSDNESDWEVSDSLSSEESCDVWLP